MTYSRRMRIFVMPVIFLFLGGAIPGNADTSNSRVAGTLFQEFETVFRSKASSLSSSSEGDFVRVPFALLLEGLAALRKQAPAEVLENSDAILVGTKDYLPPSGLGRVRSTFCYVVVLQSKNGLNLDRYFKQPASSAMGSPIWSWPASLEEFGENDRRPSTLYAAEVAQSYLLVSNNLEELQHVAAILRGSSDEASRVLTGIREWGEISRHEFWGYRRYRRIGIPNRFAAGLDGITPAAEALTLYVETDGRGILRLLTSTTSGSTTEKIDVTKGILPFTSRGPGIWRAVVPLRYRDADGSRSVFAMRWLFGFGVVV